MPITAYKLLKGTNQTQLSQVVQQELSLGGRTLVYQPWSRGGYLCQGVGVGTLDAGTVSNYFVITNATDETFATLLSNQLPYYQPIGAPVIHNNALYQVMAVVTPSANPGTPGKTPELRIASGFLQWKYTTDQTWNNLVSLTAITGPGVQLSVSDGYIKWKLTNSTAWDNLVPLSDITGPQGVKGDTGAQGIQGIKGDAGIQGPKGDIGPQGVKGDTGAQGVKGDTGAQGIQGPKGDTGLQGVQGVKGDTGSQGPQGIQGVKGDTGATGPANSLSIGTVNTGAAAATITGTAPSQTLNLSLPNYNPQSPVTRSVNIGTAYQHTDMTKAYKATVNVRATQTLTIAGTAADRLELRVGPTAASVAPSGTGGFSVGVWESGITGIALMVGAGIQDGGTMFADVPAGWYFQLNRLSGTNATVVSCFTQTMGV